MALGALTDDSVTMDVADAETNYVEGRPTWPFKMFLSLAGRGLAVVDFELFDIEHFVKDPHGALLSQNQDADTTDEMISTMDVETERRFAEESTKNDAIAYMRGRPSYVDVKRVNELGGVMMCNLNAKALRLEDGYVGHMVVLQSADAHTVVLHDPGLPPAANWSVPAQQFEAAWMFPGEDMANIIAVFPGKEQMQDFVSGSRSQ